MSDREHIIYLFQCIDEELFAISSDKTGANIPRTSCTQGWIFRQEFPLDAQDPAPTPIDVNSIIHSVTDKGYYLWRDACWAQRGTHWLAATPIPDISPSLQTTATASSNSN